MSTAERLFEGISIPVVSGRKPAPAMDAARIIRCESSPELREVSFRLATHSIMSYEPGRGVRVKTNSRPA